MRLCASCNGQGFTEIVTPVCCGNGTLHGCCGSPEPYYEQVQCQDCQALGVLPECQDCGEVIESYMCYCSDCNQKRDNENEEYENEYL